MKVSIIGGSGFVGSNLAKLFTKNNTNFQILDNVKSKFFPEKYIHGDIRNNDDYTATLALELKVIPIDKVMPEPWDTPESITRKLIKKESYWQHQLKSFESDGGLNVRNERLIANKRANAFPMATV